VSHVLAAKGVMETIVPKGLGSIQSKDRPQWASQAVKGAQAFFNNSTTRTLRVAD